MSTTSFMKYRNKRILFLNFADLDLEGVVSAMEHAGAIIAAEPPNSLLILLDVTATHISKEVSAKCKAFAKHNEPYVKSTALVGVDGIKKVIFRAVLKFTGRNNLTLFSSLDDAKKWLFQQ